MKKFFGAVIFLVVIFCINIDAQTQKRDSVLFVASSSLTANSLKLNGYTIAGITLPDSLKGTVFTFQDSWDGVTFSNVLLNDGTEVQMSFPLASSIPKRKIMAKPVEAFGYSLEIKLRTGTYAAPINQTDSLWVYIDMLKVIR